MNIFSLRAVLPSWTGEFTRIGQNLIDRDEREIMITSLAGEVLNALNCLCAILCSLDDYVQTAPDLLGVACPLK